MNPVHSPSNSPHSCALPQCNDAVVGRRRGALYCSKGCADKAAARRASKRNSGARHCRYRVCRIQLPPTPASRRGPAAEFCTATCRRRERSARERASSDLSCP